MKVISYMAIPNQFADCVALFPSILGQGCEGWRAQRQSAGWPSHQRPLINPSQRSFGSDGRARPPSPRQSPRTQPNYLPPRLTRDVRGGLRSMRKLKPYAFSAVIPTAGGYVDTRRSTGSQQTQRSRTGVSLHSAFLPRMSNHLTLPHG